jgi:hypothetical protein
MLGSESGGPGSEGTPRTHDNTSFDRVPVGPPVSGRGAQRPRLLFTLIRWPANERLGIGQEEFYRMLEGVVIDNSGLFNDRLQE